MSKQLHILFLSSWYPSRIFPTRGDFVERHARATSEFVRVSNVHLVSDPEVKEGYKVEKTTEGDLDSYIIYCKQYSNPIAKQKVFFTAFKSIFEKLEPVDAVHVNVTYPAGLIAMFLKKKHGLPYIITEHWTGYHSPNNKSIGFLQRYFTKKITQQAEAICPVSDQLTTSMRDYGLKGNYISIPNIVDTEIFKSSASVRHADDMLKILHVSNMKDEHKNVSGILRVVTRLHQEGKKVELTLVGGKPAVYEELLSQSEIDTSILTTVNQVSQKELIQYFHAADVFVLFSNYENLPCVILESFSCGLAVISTDVGGISEYFPDGFGSLIPKADEEALHQELLKLLNNKLATDPQVMHRYAQDHFSKKVVIDRYLELYKNMI